ncbi:MAG: hypothetical protein ACE5D0_08845 [Fidelibacterota bacterium]
MNRRLFLRKISGLVAIPLVIESISCEDDSIPLRSSNDNTSDSFVVTSSYDGGHSHSITIQTSDIENPPQSSKTLTSTSNGGHSHSIVLTTSDFQSLEMGETIVKTSSLNGGHTHSFTISAP